MKTKNEVLKEKEREEKIRTLRRDIQNQLEESLPEEMTEGRIKVEISKADDRELENPERAKQIIEALLFASSKPLTVQDIRKVLRPLTPRDIEQHIQALKRDYQESRRSFEIHEIAGGYEIGTCREFAPWICKIELQKKMRQASQSALETLAILAYKQPLTRAEIEDLRGVDSSGVLANLIDRGFVRIVGKKEIPGRPFLYATTDKFLEHFGLKTLAELPSIEEIRDVVEKSVRRDELLGSPKMIDVPQEEAGESGNAGEVSLPQESIEEDQKSDGSQESILSAESPTAGEGNSADEPQTGMQASEEEFREKDEEKHEAQ